MKYVGVVQRGERKGTEFGFPTVNIFVDDTSLAGIYAAIVRIGAVEHPAAAYTNPKRGILEAHLIDFYADLYGKEVTIELVKKIREHRDFGSADDARMQIGKDVDEVRDYFAQK
jgi:riboflavin kinase/FMN adenylyltransferase